MGKLQVRLAELEKEVREKDTKVITLNGQLVDRTYEIDTLTNQVNGLIELQKQNDKEAAIEFFEATVRELDGEIHEKSTSLLQAERELMGQKSTIANLTASVHKANKKLREHEQLMTVLAVSSFSSCFVLLYVCVYW